MSVQIVDALEMVDVEENDGQRRSGTPRSLEIPLGGLDERAPVVTPGQGVGLGQIDQRAHPSDQRREDEQRLGREGDQHGAGDE